MATKQKVKQEVRRNKSGDYPNIGKWYTEPSEYFDNEGTVIPKEKIKNNYLIIQKIKNVKIEENTGYIKWQYRCEKTKQLRLFQIKTEL